MTGPTLPLGTVTFLFTDVAGSTALWEEAPDAMSAAMRRHDDLIAASIEAAGGSLVRPRGEGDSRFAVFARASDAITAAVAVQRAMCTEAWQTPRPVELRIAVHTGETELRDGDYYGTAVNRCARLRSLAQPGQILASKATIDVARGRLPSGISLRDLGSRPLRDLAEPEHVYEITDAEATTFPLLASTIREAAEIPSGTLRSPDGSSTAIPPTGLRLGRSPDNDVVVDDPKASRRHASLVATPSGFVVQDLHSTNGTRVNGEAVAGERVLSSGDLIQIGSTEYVLET